MREQVGQGLPGVAVVFDHQNPQTLARTVCIFCSIFAHFCVSPGEPVLRNCWSVHFFEKIRDRLPDFSRSYGSVRSTAMADKEIAAFTCSRTRYQVRLHRTIAARLFS